MPTVNEEGFTAEELVQACNKVLLFAGLIARVSTVEEVRVVCSSTGVFVAALEGFLRHRLDDILRNPSSPAERAYNNTRVVEVLSLLLSCDLSHISGARIVEGSLEDISNTLELLAALCQGKPLLDPPAPEPAAPQLAAAGDPEQKEAEAKEARSSEEDDAGDGEEYEEDFEDGGEDDEAAAADGEGRADSDEADEQDDGGSEAEEAQKQEEEEALLQQAYAQQRQHDRAGASAASTSTAAAAGAASRRGKVSRRARAMQRLGGRRPPLSPILEASREGWEHALSAQGEGEEVSQPASRTGSRARSRASSVRAELSAAGPSATAASAPAAGAAPGIRRTGSSRSSGGGASSVISIPSVRSQGAGGVAGVMDSPLQLPRTEPGLRRQGSQGERSAALGSRQPSATPAAARSATGGLPHGYSSYGQPVGDQQQQHRHAELEAEDTATLLERAVAHAERTLQDLGYAYEDFYYSDDLDDLEDGLALQDQASRRRAAAAVRPHAGAAVSGSRNGRGARGAGDVGAPIIRPLRKSAWPDGREATTQQHNDFLRRAKRVLAGGSTTASEMASVRGGPPRSSSAGSASARSRSTTSSSLGGGVGRVPKGLMRAAQQGPAELALVSAIGPKQRPSKKIGAAGSSSGSGKVKPGGAKATARGSGRQEGAFVELPGSVLPPAPAQHGRQLLQRTAASYEAVLPAPVLLAGRGELFQGPGGRPGDGDHELGSDEFDDGYYDDGDVDDVGASLRAQQRYQAQQRTLQADGSVRPGVHLSADLASRLKYLYDLAKENPKQAAVRAAVQQVAVRDELMRHIRRRQLVDRLAGARARREAALRLTANRLHEQRLEYEKRMEQLRLQRLAAEWHDKQRGAAMRRALAAELELREAFMEVLAQEKERLLVERRDTGRGAAFPQYKKAMRKAEDQYLALYNTLENLLASERQQRLRAAREAMAAQQESNALAAEVVHDRVAELLARVSAEEEAILARHSVGTRPEKKAELVGQIRRLLGLN
ncbi:hypothetical protein HYH02_003949 [Chlamydomonas schloesseri]|uniref:DUF5745 domain-containing protein n=1 Tax=Chlamydomonas schloesseri TaxID=2026947 RepID=A0A835WPL7_9CHLO|nr:hypothetical protein HYH02_003949 [Chlamydomonas schloesseri]|eukprot:KAG2451345.1 hypothetical protein HYH02_003949 [Chlamydomonas schloesseri]